LSNLTKSVL